MARESYYRLDIIIINYRGNIHRYYLGQVRQGGQVRQEHIISE